MCLFGVREPTKSTQHQRRQLCSGNTCVWCKMVCSVLWDIFLCTWLTQTSNDAKWDTILAVAYINTQFWISVTTQFVDPLLTTAAGICSLQLYSQRLKAYFSCSIISFLSCHTLPVDIATVLRVQQCNTRQHSVPCNDIRFGPVGDFDLMVLLDTNLTTLGFILWGADIAPLKFWVFYLVASETSPSTHRQ